jgi:hypothetical protein
MLADGSAVGDAASDVVSERAQDEDAAAVDGGPSDVAPSVDAADAADERPFVVGLGYETVPTCAPDAGADAGGPLLRTRCDFAGACCPAGQLCANGVCTEERSLHGGRDHMCLRVRDKVSCWGTSTNGATGTDAILPVVTPPMLAQPGTSGPVYAMANYSFSNEFIVGPRRSVGFWGGRHAFGREDDADGVRGPTPVMINNTDGMLELAQPSRTGVRCGITMNRQVRCWGCARAGARGDGSSPSPPCATSEMNPGAITLPIPERIAQVAIAGTNTGDRYSSATVCSLDEFGGVRCWGLNNVGQRGIGINSNEGMTSLRAEASPLIMSFEAVEIAGLESAFCAIRRDRTVVCWGNRGRYGAVGMDAEQLSPEVLLRSDSNAPLTDAHMLRCGEGACCAVQRSTGTLFCWGVQDGVNRRIAPAIMGEPFALGPTPLNVAGIAERSIEAVGVGDSLCVIGRDEVRPGQRALVCWGDNNAGEAGAPVAQTTGFHAVAVAGL